MSSTKNMSCLEDEPLPVSYDTLPEKAADIDVPLGDVDGTEVDVLAETTTPFKLIPRGGFLSGVFNLAGSSVGAGILALPYAFSVAGVLVCTFYLVSIFVLTVFSVRLLGLVADKKGAKSYEGLCKEVFGRGGDMFTAVIMVIKCFGGCVAYVICVGDVWGAFLRKEYVGDYFGSKGFHQLMTSISFIVLMLPLSLPKHINALRYVSLVGVSFILLFVLGIIVHSCAATLQDGFDNGGLSMYRDGWAAVQGLGLCMFAYLCQSNVFEVRNEMRPAPDVNRLQLECGVGMLICTILYWLSGFFGYLEFGDTVTPSILLMYTPAKNVFFAIAYCGIVVKLCVAFALHILPCRDAIYHMIGWDLHAISSRRNILFCSSLSLLSLLLGLFAPDIKVVFGFLGSFVGGLIGFVLPALLYLKTRDTGAEGTDLYDFAGSIVLLVSGVIVVVLGTSVTVFDYL